MLRQVWKGRLFQLVLFLELTNSVDYEKPKFVKLTKF